MNEPNLRPLLDKILASPQFSAARRMQRFLEFVTLRTIAGEFDQLKETNVGVEVFDREVGYDPKIDAIVRVEARRLRMKLEQYYRHEGAADRVRFVLPVGSYVMEFQQAPGTAPPAEAEGTEVRPLFEPPWFSRAAAKPITQWPGWAQATAALVALGLLLGATWWLRRRVPAAHEPVLRRLTADAGLSTDPALSSDGRFLIYASDRGGEDHLSLWRIDTAGGEPVRLTNEPYDNREPAIHPSGRSVAFRSEREGGGIYLLSLDGGLPSLIAKEGRRPRFSPDGSWLLYWMRDERYSPSRAYVVASSGGEPRQVGADFADIHNPVWSPDGASILFCGTRVSGAAGQEHDWWVLPFPSGEPRRTGAIDALTRHARELGGRLRTRGDQLGIPHAWIDGQILFSASLGDSDNLWRIAIDSRGNVEDKPQRITFGTSTDTAASAAGRAVAFSSGSLGIDIWSAPLDRATGRAKGEARRLTWQPGIEFQPALSPDGKTLAYVADRGDARNVYLLDLASGRELALAGENLHQDYPHFSADGETLAVRNSEGPRMAVYTYRRDGTGRRLVSADGGAPTGWSHDGRWLLFEPGALMAYAGLLNVKTGESSVLLQHGDWSLRSPRFSPDGQWIAVQADSGRGSRRIFVVPYRQGVAIPASEWIAVSDGASADYQPVWSDDGQILYFLSDRNGARAVWARRIHPVTRQPVGEPFEVYATHSARRTLLRNFRTGLDRVGLCITAGHITFALDEVSSNVWLTNLGTEQPSSN